MAEANEATVEEVEGEGKKKGGKKKILIVVVLVLGVGGFLGSKMLGGGEKAAAKGATTTTAPPKELGVVQLDPVTVSIDQGAYVKLDLSVTVVVRPLKDGETAPEWEAGEHGFTAEDFKAGPGQIARSEASRILRESSLDEISAPGGTEHVEEKITKAIEKAYKGSVSEVLYGDFLWQQ